MATFTYRGITYTAYYVDNTGSNGDGSTPSNSANTFPTWSSVAANTAIIVRRTNTISISTALNSNNNVMLCGSPRPNDLLYTIIPDSSVWGADVQDFPIFNMASATTGLRWSGENPVCELIDIKQTRTNAHSVSGILSFTHANGGAIVKNCRITMDSTATYVNQNDQNLSTTGIYLVGTNAVIDSNFIEVGSRATAIQTITNADNISIINNTIRVWNNLTSGTNIVLDIASSSLCIIKGNTFLVKKVSGAGTFYIVNLPSGVVAELSDNIYTYEVSNVTLRFYTLTLARIDALREKFTINNLNTSSSVALFANSNSDMNITFKDCEFITTNETNTGAVYLTQNTSNSSSVNYINCVFNGNFIIGNTVATDQNESKIFSGCTFTRCSPVFDLPISLGTLTTSNQGSGLYLKNNAIVYIDTLNLVNPADTGITLRSNSKLFIKNLNADLQPGPYQYLTFGANTNDATIYVQNENGIEGFWTARNRMSSIIPSNTYRQGGANYSFKCKTRFEVTPRKYITMAPQPFDGIPVTFGTTGMKKITVFFAEKLYDTTSPLVNINDFILEVEIPQETTGLDKTVVNSQSNGQIVSDNVSTWVNDPGLIARKLELTFDLKQSGTVQCRLRFYKFITAFPNGYLVFDPQLIGENL